MQSNKLFIPITPLSIFQDITSFRTVPPVQILLLSYPYAASVSFRFFPSDSWRQLVAHFL